MSGGGGGGKGHSDLGGLFRFRGDHSDLGGLFRLAGSVVEVKCLSASGIKTIFSEVNQNILKDRK